MKPRRGDYVCPLGHRTPAAEVRSHDHVIQCPHPVGATVQCSRLARLYSPSIPEV